MTRRAEIDPRLSVRVLDSRPLRYDRPADPADDRPAHVRAASGLAVHHGRLVVVQDDAAFLAVVAADGVSAIQLPRGVDGRRRFEIALGNKDDKLDLESCIAIDDELWAFGSGRLPIRDKICRVRRAVAQVIDAGAFYARMRTALGGAINLEGVARAGTELWLFHRGNTGGGDGGPAVMVIALDALRSWLDGRGALPSIERVERYDLGAIDGHSLGFTDAFAHSEGVFYLAAAEASADAIEDGRVFGSQLGVIKHDAVRASPLRAADGAPIKAEGIALDAKRAGHAWIVLDPDDPEQPATLLEVELIGPWLGG